MNNKGVGLLAIWASAIAAMFALYFMFRMLTPLVGEVDYHAWTLLNNPDFNVSQEWLDLYQSINLTMQNGFSVLVYACFVSIILFVVVQSARRRTDAYEDDF